MGENFVRETLKDPIGVASIDSDGTLTLQLRIAEAGIIAHPPDIRYKKQDKDYELVFNHIAPIKPGESKLVMPFPDERAKVATPTVHKKTQ